MDRTPPRARAAILGVSEREQIKVQHPEIVSHTSRTFLTTRFNRMKWGVMVHDILPCRGTKCLYRPTCRYIGRRPQRLQCRRGGVCPAELETYRRIVDTATRGYPEARGRLGSAVFEQTVHDFAILILRKERLSARIADEGLVVTRTLGDGSLEVTQGLAFRRYQTAIDNQFKRLVDLVVGVSAVENSSPPGSVEPDSTDPAVDEHAPHPDEPETHRCDGYGKDAHDHEHDAEQDRNRLHAAIHVLSVLHGEAPFSMDGPAGRDRSPSATVPSAAQG